MLEADVLLAHALRTTREWLAAHPEAAVEPAAREAYDRLIEQRAARCPVAYLTGVREFCGHSFRVRRGVFIPRPETEHLVETAVAWARGPGAGVPGIVVDACTGSGAVAVSLALQLRRAIVATDCSREAVELARENAEQLGADPWVRVAQGDLLAPLGPVDGGEPVAAVVSNPPYVPREILPDLPVDVRDFEPRAALDGGPGGLDTIRRLVAAAAGRLTAGGLLAFELDPGQAEAAAALLAGPRWAGVRLVPDLAGRARVVAAVRGPESAPRPRGGGLAEPQDGC